MIKDLGPGVFRIWQELRPMTKKMLVGELQSTGSHLPSNPAQKAFYDAHADWEISRLLTALDEQSDTSREDTDRSREISELAETCVRLLEAQTGSAEVFIQLASRAIRNHDYNKLDKLSDRLIERFSAPEIAEIARQTDLPQIRAIAFETLSLLPVQSLAALLYDSLYSEIAANALEQKAIEYESEEARDALEAFESEIDIALD